MRSATEGSGDNKGLSEKLDSEDKEKIMDALKDGQSWLDSNPEADAEEIIAAQGNSIRAFLKPWEDIAVYISPGREIPLGTSDDPPLACLAVQDLVSTHKPEGEQLLPAVPEPS